MVPTLYFRFGGGLSIAKIVSQATGRDRMHGTSRWAKKGRPVAKQGGGLLATSIM